MTVEDIDQVAGDFMDGEIVDLASDWLGNTVGDLFLSGVSPPDKLSVGRSKAFRKMLARTTVRNA